MPEPSHPLNRNTLIRVFFFSAFAFILYQLILLAAPFMTALLGAATLAMIFHPLHVRLLRGVRNPTWASLLSTLCVLVVAVLPLAGMSWFFVRETAQLAPMAQQFFEDIRSRDWPALMAHLPHLLQRGVQTMSELLEKLNFDFRQTLLDNAQTIGGQTTYWISQALRHIVVTLINLLILTVGLFFSFRDGERFLNWGLSLVPMQKVHKQSVAKRVYETFRAVVVGSLLTASTQGAVALLGFIIAGVRLPVLLGLGTTIAAMLGASFLVTVPVALTVLRESTGWGVFLLVWGIAVVGVIDNVVKPIFIGKRARMPFIVIFFSIVGGIKLYGFMGFILGPILVASFLSFVEIYRQEYNDPT